MACMSKRPVSFSSADFWSRWGWGGVGRGVSHATVRVVRVVTYVNNRDPSPPHHPELEDAPHLPHLEGGARHRGRHSPHYHLPLPSPPTSMTPPTPAGTRTSRLVFSSMRYRKTTTWLKQRQSTAKQGAVTTTAATAAKCRLTN